jgi:hypothetical protein
MTTTHTDTTHARNLLAQLELGTKMRCGMRDFVAVPGGLQAKVGGRQNWVTVTVNELDLYDVEFVHMTRNYDRVVLLTLSGVHAADLNRLLCDAEGHGWKAVR